MVRILHYIGLLQFGGSQSFVMEIYRKIDRSKLQFDFVSFPGEKSGFYDEIISLGGRVYECPQYNGKNHFIFIKWWNDFFKEHSEYKIIHGHVRSVASIYIPIAKKYGLTTIAHSHSTSNGTGISAKIKDIMQLSVRRQADYLFACSDEAGKWMFGKDVINRTNYKVIPNAIDAERFVFNPDKRNKVRKKLGIENKYVIGTVGRLTEPKNHKFLIDILSIIHKDNPNTVLMIVGDGELRNSLENQVKSLELKESVFFLGSRSNTQDYYQAMDVFAFPSLWEGLGIVAIEAQCAGLHCVVSERIPKSIDIEAGLIEIVNLKDADVWAESLLKYQSVDRLNQLKKVKDSGYDVTENANNLQKFYLK